MTHEIPGVVRLETDSHGLKIGFKNQRLEFRRQQVHSTRRKFQVRRGWQ